MALKRTNKDAVKQSLGKRLVIFVSVTVIGFSFSLLSALNKLDSSDHKADLAALNLLTQFEKRPVERSLNSEQELRGWLEKTKKQISDKNLAARKQLIKWLEATGVKKEEVTRQKGQRPQEFSATEFELASDDRNILQRKQIDQGYGQMSYRYVLATRQTVDDHLQRLNVLFVPRKLVVATDIVNEQLREPAARPNLPLQGFSLVDGQFILRFHMTIAAGQSAVVETSDMHFTAAVEKVEIPSIAEVTMAGVGTLKRLYKDNRRTRRLAAVYGDLTLVSARSLASEYAVKSYKEIELLGFTFSTHRFPLALAVILTIVSLGNFLTVRTARRERLAIITDVTNESVFDILLHTLGVRVVVWMIIPILAIWLALPPFPLVLFEKAFLGLASLVILILGWRTVADSATL